MTTVLPFADLQVLGQSEGLSVLACIAPPGPLDPRGIDQAIADGLGNLRWMAEQRGLRLNPVTMLPTARSLVVAVWDYQAELQTGSLKRARYGAGKDYHILLRQKLGRIGRRLGQGQRACVDSAPINERTIAHLAGLGWLGRNALLIDPTAGSYRFLGVLLTEVEIERHRGPHGADRCGSCTRCETACPTAALVGRRVLSERCISYLTIEHDGPIPRELAARFQGWWFGCDICQEVCPWNRFAPGAADPRLTGSERDADLLAVTEETFDLHFAGRAVRRLTWSRFRRNLVVAFWSLGQVAEATALARASRDIPVVAAQARELGLDLGATTSEA